MTVHSAIAVPGAASRWAHSLAAAIFASLLGACSTTPPSHPTPVPAEEEKPKVEIPRDESLIGPSSEGHAEEPAQEAPSPPEGKPPPPEEKSPPPEEKSPPPEEKPPPPEEKSPPPASEAPKEPPSEPVKEPPPESPTTPKAAPGTLPDQPISPIPEEGSENDNVLETARRKVRSSTEWLARGVDSWFGDLPFNQGGGVKDGRLSLGFFKRQGESIDTRVRFSARVHLPNVEEHTYLFFGRDNERDVVSDTPGAFSRQDRLLAETAQDRSFFTGLGYSLRDAIDFRLGFHSFKPYAQARYRRPWTLSERDLVEFRQTFFADISDRLGSTTALSYEHAVASDFAVRWLTANTITQVTRANDWSSILGAYKTFGGQRLLSVELIASGRINDPVTVAEYGPQLKWLQPIYRDWLEGELLVGYFFPRVDRSSERGRRWALGYATTMRF